MTTASSDMLERLLSLSSKLTANTNCAPSSITLTLKQLIPFHECLLDSIFLDIDTERKAPESEPSCFHGQSELESIVRPYIRQKNIKRCVHILSLNDGNSKVLLVLQFLLRLSKVNSDSDCDLEHTLVGLTRVTFPLLMRSENYGTQLREAILDASICGNAQNSIYEDELCYTRLDILTKCTNLISFNVITVVTSTSYCSTTLDWMYTVVEISSRVLIRLLSVFTDDMPTYNEKKEDCRQIVLESMHTITLSVLNATCYYSTDQLLANGKESTLLRPITALLLPALFPPEDRIEKVSSRSKWEERLLEIWTFIVGLIVPEYDKSNEFSSSGRLRRCRTWDYTAPIAATSILCILIPSIQSFALPVPNHQNIDLPGETAPQRLRLVNQSSFWDFLQKSLKSGVKTGDEWSEVKCGAGFGSNSLGRGADNNQMVRRRTIHIMRLLIDKELSLQNQMLEDDFHIFMLMTWKKYIICFETLEMEKEIHLVDQIWDTVLELCVACNVENKNKDLDKIAPFALPPPMSWEWISSLFARILLSDSPTLRKLALFRFLIGRAGVSMSVDSTDARTSNYNTLVKSKLDEKQKMKGRKRRSLKSTLQPAALSLVSPSFVLEVLLPSYDSLGSSVGTGVQFEVDGSKRNDDLTNLVGSFIPKYMQSLVPHQEKLNAFVAGLLTDDFINGCRTKTLVLCFDNMVQCWSSSRYHSSVIHLSNETLENAVKAFQKLLSTGSIVFRFRQSLNNGFATLLSHSTHSDSSTHTTLNPKVILRTLSLFPSPIFCSAKELTDGLTKNEVLYEMLKDWLCRLGGIWVSEVAAACAASFISGDLVPFSSNASGIPGEIVVLTDNEQIMGTSIAKLCALADGTGKTAASRMMWPAINKGLSYASVYSRIDLFSPFPDPPMSSEMTQKIARAILLLQSGCNEYVLSGMGHGDLIIDKNNEAMLPPPRNVELLLTNAMNFIFYQVSAICNVVTVDCESKNCGDHVRLGVSTIFLSHFSVLLNQIKALHRAYPSSIAMPQLASSLLNKLLQKLMEHNQFEKNTIKTDFMADYTIERVRYMSLAFASLTFGGEVNSIFGKDRSEDCRVLLNMSFIEPNVASHGIEQWQLKAMRSLFQCCKWGVLSHLLPLAISINSTQQSAFEAFDELFDIALESVDVAPPSALLAIFETCCSVVHSLGISNNQLSIERKEQVFSRGYAKTMNKILKTFFSVINDAVHNPTRAHMLEKICKLVFRPGLLMEEYHAMRALINIDGEYDKDADLPILKAFRLMVEIAGTKKPYVLKYALSYISVAWLGIAESPKGVTALPYRDDIANLLLYKEMKLNETSTHQESLVFHESTNAYCNDTSCRATVPVGTPETSTVRGFLFVFLSELPNVDDGLSRNVLSGLCHYLIFRLLDEICSVTSEDFMLMTGSVCYSRKIRAWQSMCILSRFVTFDIVDSVLLKLFKAMSQTMHGQIRYFVEVFAIQCARRHPEKFRPLFIKEVCRRDLPQQLLCSLMIIGGNLVVGRYSADFLYSFPSETRKSHCLKLLSGVIPWLGSTQGFCRAIAQLLVHKLIPDVLPLAKSAFQSSQNLLANDWFLKSIFDFLEVNAEMKRLRRKQSKFFERYDVDSVCSPSILTLAVDEGDEPLPLLLVDSIKQCLGDLYHETHGEDAPLWKQIEDLTTKHSDINDDEGICEDSENALVNFQRKILPLDSLNLALEAYRKRSMENAAGRKRQSLIVCATLIDKVPNLAGLARTAEIFAAEKMIVPDLNICKMNNFRSISVTAEDWIKIEEVSEENLLVWLKQRKDEGYMVVGVEQTSSSECLTKLKFPKETVLLLGKEKEGIPVKFLQECKVCVQIPQLGIIRSLNVHVSGAIAIWEYSKQMM